jgi:hypothetical protein
MGDLNDLKRKRGIGNLNSEKMPYDYFNREYGTVPRDTKGPVSMGIGGGLQNVHRIVARGYDTTELMEEGYGVVDVLFVDYQSRIPLIEEEQVLNYVMILALEDGLSPPAAMSRIVARTRPSSRRPRRRRSLPSGTPTVPTPPSATGWKYLKKTDAEKLSLAEAAARLVKDWAAKEPESLGVSNLMLKDPSAKRMIARAENSVAGKYIAFMKEIVKAAQKQSKEPVDIDMLGATGAVMMDLGFSAEAAWAILAVTRACDGRSLYQEIERLPYLQLGQSLTPKEDYDGPADRPVPPLKDRAKVAQSAVCHSVDEWVQAREERKKLVGSGHAVVEEIEDPSKKSGIKRVGKL